MDALAYDAGVLLGNAITKWVDTGEIAQNHRILIGPSGTVALVAVCVKTCRPMLGGTGQSMIDWDDTPATLALKQQIRELTAENQFLKMEKGLDIDQPVFTNYPDLEPINISYKAPFQLSLVADWNVRWDAHSLRPHAIGRARTREGDLTYSYFLESPHLLQPGLAHNVLAYMHERVVRRTGQGLGNQMATERDAMTIFQADVLPQRQALPKGPIPPKPEGEPMKGIYDPVYVRNFFYHAPTASLELLLVVVGAILDERRKGA